MTPSNSFGIKMVRPLVFLDFETTGLQPEHDRIVSLAALKVTPDGKTKEFISLVNPKVKVPKEASSVHGLTNKHLKSQPSFKELAKEFHQFLKQADFAGFNILGFDLPLLGHELRRARLHLNLEGRVVIDVMEIFHFWHRGKLSDAYEIYLGKKLEGAHSAVVDCRACIEIFQAQVGKHMINPPTVEGLAKFCLEMRGGFLDSGRWLRKESGVVVLARGKHRGRSLAEIARHDPSYLQWVLELNDSKSDTQKLIKSAIE